MRRVERQTRVQLRSLRLSLAIILTLEPIMRRAQSLKHHARASVSTFSADDLGVLREAGEETIEDVLRQQLSEKTRENEKVRSNGRNGYETKVDSIKLVSSERRFKRCRCSFSSVHH